jgi:hypothetical protein
MKINWTCPFCGHDAIVHDKDEGTVSKFRHVFKHDNKYGYQVVNGTVIVCPNDECKEYVLVVSTSNAKLDQFSVPRETDTRRTWRLVPASQAKVFPDYIPEPIRADYNEACLIRDLSPRASATLSRRCLQGMIRDFWNVRKKRLVDEIDAIKVNVDSETWDAIDAVRHIGNIGAHMEKDINVIVDVDPEEAQLLIELVETLLTDWYVAKNERQKRMAAVKVAAASKKQLQASGVTKPQSPVTTTT